MAPGLPDRVDCASLAEEATVLERTYLVSEMPRLRDLLADLEGSAHVNFSFAKLSSGRSGATVAIEAAPHPVCQRCLQGFVLPVSSSSEIEFASADEVATDSQRELYAMKDGTVSLRELAEEELLLALPIVAACSTPTTCGKAPRYDIGDDGEAATGETSRPFAALQDLLKKT